MIAYEDVVNALHTVEDPELGMDIVELGLFYDAEIDGEKVKVVHSLTSMGCPAGPMIQEGIVDAVRSVDGVGETHRGRRIACPTTPSSSSASANRSLYALVADIKSCVSTRA